MWAGGLSKHWASVWTNTVIPEASSPTTVDHASWSPTAPSLIRPAFEGEITVKDPLNTVSPSSQTASETASPVRVVLSSLPTTV